MNSGSNGRVNFSQDEGQREANGYCHTERPVFQQVQSWRRTLSNGRTLKWLLHLPYIGIVFK